jgi:hypothetical protein
MKIKIMKETSAFLLQLHHWSARCWSIATQTQVLQAMTQLMVKIHQSIIEQASLPKDHNTITNDNHQNMTPPPFDRNEMAKDRVPIGPVKRQVVEACNNQRKKKKHEALKPTIEKQHEINKALVMCPCGEHHGFSCPRRKLVL